MGQPLQVLTYPGRDLSPHLWFGDTSIFLIDRGGMLPWTVPSATPCCSIITIPVGLVGGLWATVRPSQLMENARISVLIKSRTAKRTDSISVLKASRPQFPDVKTESPEQRLARHSSRVVEAVNSNLRAVHIDFLLDRIDQPAHLGAVVDVFLHFVL